MNDEQADFVQELVQLIYKYSKLPMSTRVLALKLYRDMLHEEMEASEKRELIQSVYLKMYLEAVKNSPTLIINN